jgi:KUP system potassium uptake protein
VIILEVQFEEIPWIDAAERAVCVHVSDDIWRARVRFGFIEIPDLPTALAALPTPTPDWQLKGAIWFSMRDLVVDRPENHTLPDWQAGTFAFLYRNAARVVDRFNLPQQQVVEVSREVQI